MLDRFLTVQVSILFPVCICLAFSGRLIGGETPDERPGPVSSFRLITDREIVSPGDTFEVTLSISSDKPLELVAWSMEFDTEFLEFIEAVVDPSIPANPNNSRFEWYHDEGENWMQGVLEVFPGTGGPGIPRGAGVQVAVMRFRVRAEAPAGTATVSFTSSGDAGYRGHLISGDQPVYNRVRGPENGSSLPDPARPRFEHSVDPTFEDDPLRIAILGDVGLFNRGDANTDGILDISDPIFLLSYLYLDGPEPLSAYAADVNADGRVNIGDPIALIHLLYAGES